MTVLKPPTMKDNKPQPTTLLATIRARRPVRLSVPKKWKSRNLTGKSARIQRTTATMKGPLVLAER